MEKHELVKSEEMVSLHAESQKYSNEYMETKDHDFHDFGDFEDGDTGVVSVEVAGRGEIFHENSSLKNYPSIPQGNDYISDNPKKGYDGKSTLKKDSACEDLSEDPCDSDLLSPEVIDNSIPQKNFAINHNNENFPSSTVNTTNSMVRLVNSDDDKIDVDLSIPCGRKEDFFDPEKSAKNDERCDCITTARTVATLNDSSSNIASVDFDDCHATENSHEFSRDISNPSAISPVVLKDNDTWNIIPNNHDQNFLVLKCPHPPALYDHHSEMVSDCIDKVKDTEVYVTNQASNNDCEKPPECPSAKNNECPVDNTQEDELFYNSLNFADEEFENLRTDQACSTRVNDNEELEVITNNKNSDDSNNINEIDVKRSHEKLFRFRRIFGQVIRLKFLPFRHQKNQTSDSSGNADITGFRPQEKVENTKLYGQSTKNNSCCPISPPEFKKVTQLMVSVYNFGNDLFRGNKKISNRHKKNIDVKESIKRADKNCEVRVDFDHYECVDNSGNSVQSCNNGHYTSVKNDTVNTDQVEISEFLSCGGSNNKEVLFHLSQCKLESEFPSKVCEHLRKIELHFVKLNAIQSEHPLRRLLLENGILNVCLDLLSQENARMVHSERNVQLILASLAVLVHMSMNDDTTQMFSDLNGMRIVMNTFNFYFDEVMNDKYDMYSDAEKFEDNLNFDDQVVAQINSPRGRNLSVEILILIWRLMFATISDGHNFAQKWIECGAILPAMQSLKSEKKHFNNLSYIPWVLGALRLIIRSDESLSIGLVKDGLFENIVNKLKIFPYDPLLVENSFAVLANALQHFFDHAIALDKIPNIWEFLLSILLKDELIQKDDVVYQGLFVLGIAASHCYHLRDSIRRAGGLILCDRVLEIHADDLDIIQFSFSLKTLLNSHKSFSKDFDGTNIDDNLGNDINKILKEDECPVNFNHNDILGVVDEHGHHINVDCEKVDVEDKSIELVQVENSEFRIGDDKNGDKNNEEEKKNHGNTIKLNLKNIFSSLIGNMRLKRCKTDVIDDKKCELKKVQTIDSYVRKVPVMVSDSFKEKTLENVEKDEKSIENDRTVFDDFKGNDLTLNEAMDMDDNELKYDKFNNEKSELTMKAKDNMMSDVLGNDVEVSEDNRNEYKCELSIKYSPACESHNKDTTICVTNLPNSRDMTNEKERDEIIESKNDPSRIDPMNAEEIITNNFMTAKQDEKMKNIVDASNNVIKESPGEKILRNFKWSLSGIQNNNDEYYNGNENDNGKTLHNDFIASNIELIKLSLIDSKNSNSKNNFDEDNETMENKMTCDENSNASLMKSLFAIYDFDMNSDKIKILKGDSQSKSTLIDSSDNILRNSLSESLDVADYIEEEA